MSADNWAVCPKCLEEIIAERDAAIKKAKAQCGKIPEEDYERMKREAQNMPERPEETLGENYWIGMDESGQFAVSYSASCTRCTFAFAFEYTETSNWPRAMGR